MARPTTRCSWAFLPFVTRSRTTSSLSHHKSVPAAQVLYQLKTLSTAFFSVTILGKSFRIPQWISFVLLMAGVCLVQSQDAKSSASATGAYPPSVYALQWRRQPSPVLRAFT